MIDNGAWKWRKYKADFLKANKCTADEFERAYIAFQESNPDIQAYRRFARKYGITIHPEPRLPEKFQVTLSVNIAAIKVMAATYEESLCVREIISDVFGPQH